MLRSMLVGLTMGTLALTSVVSAQTGTNCLRTLMDANNSGNSGGVVYFDLAIGPNALTFTDLYLNLAVPEQANVQITVYVTSPGMSHVGNELNLGAWTQVSGGIGVSAGPQQATHVPLDNTFVLNAGSTQGVAIRALAAQGTGGLRYTNGTGVNQVHMNADLTLTGGAATNALFGPSVFTPRIFNGWLYYNGGTAGCTITPPPPPPPPPPPLPTVNWTIKAPAPEARSRGAGAIVGDYFYYMGGEAAGGARNLTCWKYHIPTDTWSPIANMPSNGVGNGGTSNVDAAALGTDIYVVGGFDGTVQRREVYRYDTLTDTWENITTDLHPTGIFAHAVVAVNGRIMTIGGQPSTTTFTSACYLYNPAAPAGTRWTATSPLSAPRRYHAATVIGDQVWVGGGIGSDTATQIKTIEVYNSQAPAWALQTAQANIGRGGPAMYNLKGDPYLVTGGWDQYRQHTEILSGSMWEYEEGVNIGVRTLAYDGNDSIMIKAGGFSGAGFHNTLEVYELSGGCGCVCNYDVSTGQDVCDIFDFLTFGNMFSAADPCACDLDVSTGPAVCDIFDFLTFGNLFSAGCP